MGPHDPMERFMDAQNNKKLSKNIFDFRKNLKIRKKKNCKSANFLFWEGGKCRKMKQQLKVEIEDWRKAP